MSIKSIIAEGQAKDLWASIPAGPRRALAQSAAAEFGLRGYHATTTRHIAARAGMSPAGLYVHYPTKSDLLFAIALIGHTSVLERLREVHDSTEGAELQLHAMVHAFMVWHAVNAHLARVLQYEITALEPKHFEAVAQLRREVKSLLKQSISRFSLPNERGEVILRLILSLGIDIARWYDPKRQITPERLAGDYSALVMELVLPKQPQA